MENNLFTFLQKPRTLSELTLKFGKGISEKIKSYRKKGLIYFYHQKYFLRKKFVFFSKITAFKNNFFIDGIKIRFSPHTFYFHQSLAYYKIDQSPLGTEEAVILDVVDPFPEHVYGSFNNGEVRFFLSNNFFISFNKDYHFAENMLYEFTLNEVKKGLLILSVKNAEKIINKKRFSLLKILYSYGLNDAFSHKCLEETKTLELISDDRKTLLDEAIYTIDGAFARDFDDAVSIKKSRDHYKIGIYIADVGFFVRFNTEIAREAAFRGTSIYLADEVFPMLPKAISEGVCSLMSGNKRKVIGLLFTLTGDGKVLDPKLIPLEIIVKQNLTYEFVEKHKENPFILNGFIKTLFEVKTLLLNKRKERKAILFSTEERLLNLDDDGRLVFLETKKHLESEETIEELMILANEIVGKIFYEKGLECVYRVHDYPPKEKVKALNATLKGFNLKLNYPVKKEAFLSLKKALPKNEAFTSLLLRSMAKAEYNKNRGIHFGLESAFYTHFTAPIRRYCDLCVNWLIHKYIFLEDYEAFNIEEATKIMNDTEKRAVAIEYDAFSIKTSEYAETLINQVFIGFITNIFDYGMYVNFNDGFEGLLLFKKRTSKFIKDKKTVLINRVLYRFGDKIKVKVTSVNRREKQIYLELINGKTNHSKH